MWMSAPRQVRLAPSPRATTRGEPQLGFGSKKDARSNHQRQRRCAEQSVNPFQVVTFWRPKPNVALLPQRRAGGHSHFGLEHPDHFY